jgi:zona occludens toxin
MITLFTGSPGAGKTASLVDFLSKLPGNRPLFVHFDEKAKRDPEQVLLHESLTLPHQAVLADDWPAALPHGSILVIDEVQDVWRARPAGSKVPPAIAALETHRHSGIDVYLTTQAPSLLDANVRRLVGRHVHIRDTGVLGRYWYEWPECNDAMQWKTCVNKKSFRLPKKAFALYKSSSLHTVPVRGVPRALIYAVIAFLVLAVLIYAVTRVISKATSAAVPVVAPVVFSAPGASILSPARSDGPRPIDDRVDFIPRVSDKPESAPAYAHLRVIVAMPTVSGAICVNDSCRCMTAQSTDVGMSSAECRAWVDKRPFNPYLLAVVPVAPLAVQPVASRIPPTSL